MMLVLQERKQIGLGVLDLLLGLLEMSVFLVQKFLCVFIFVPPKLNTETLSGETRRELYACYNNDLSDLDCRSFRIAWEYILH